MQEEVQILVDDNGTKNAKKLKKSRKPVPLKSSSLLKDHIVIGNILPAEGFHGVPTIREASYGFDEFSVPDFKRT